MRAPRILVLNLLALLLCAPRSMEAASAQVAAGPWVPGAMIVDASRLEAGANSFSEWQARNRLASHRLNSVRFLRKDERGFWRGRAWHAGTEVEVAMDFRGRIAVGPEVAALDRWRADATGSLGRMARSAE